MSTQPPPVSPELIKSSVFSTYQAARGVFDELLDESGKLRPSWKKFCDAVDSMGPTRLERRWQRARRQVRDSGVTYQRFGEPTNEPRPWKLDAVPWLISAKEWAGIADGLRQRARLLNIVLNDLYGPQKLVKSGQIPPELLFAHPGFVRAFHGQKPTKRCLLHFYTADLARSPDGTWWVVSDRTDAPLGCGYALENRLVLSRTYPNIFRECNVERLASFFISMRETIQTWAPQNRENPKVVLLSQGPGTPGYFEDVYLARYLGYTLVEGGDLTVREERVMLKTLGGLTPVDVIMRRLTDQWSDPLETQSDAALGVAGLMRVIRAGKVLVTNALGSSLVESKAFMAFMNPLCEHVLGEPLKIPSVATWWCGESKEMKYVLKNYRRLLVTSAYRVARTESVSALSGKQWTDEAIQAAIKASPTSFVAQEQVNRCSVPSWQDGRMVATRAALRVYLVASGDDYAVMPGGLARIADDNRLLEYDVLAGDCSKDVWVMSETPVRPISLLPKQGQTIALKRGGPELPSRVADNLLWLGRYIERVEGGARLMRTLLVRLSGEEELRHIPEFPYLVRQAAKRGLIEPGFAVDGIRDQLPALEEALPNALVDPEQPGSLKSILQQIARIASLVRDRLSPDCWLTIQNNDQQLTRPKNDETIELSDAISMLNRLLMGLSALVGLMAENMTRTQGWRFLDLGRRFERGLAAMGSLKDLCEIAEPGPSVLEAFLEAADSSMTYRSRYLASWSRGAVLDLLLTDESNPRSVIFQLIAIAQHVKELGSFGTNPLPSPEQQSAEAMLHMVRMLTQEHLEGRAEVGGYPKLILKLEELERQLPSMFELINARYLVHAKAARTMTNVSVAPVTDED